MSSQGLAEYRAKQKKDWRGWQWNRIVERLYVPVEDAVVLYLCGPEDLDRKKALERGFRNENLIAVDFSEENVKRVRAGGGLAICHDLDELLHSWPPNWTVDVIVADYCSGLNKATMGLIHSLFLTRSLDCSVVSVNLMRGRDPVGVETIKAHRLDALDNGGSREKFNPGKHRGFAFVMGMYNYCATKLGVPAGTPIDANIPTDTFAACYNSYTSTGITWFDTAVFRWPGPPGGKWHISNPSCITVPARRKIAACRAVRTQRRNANG